MLRFPRVSQELCRQHMAAKSPFTRPEPGGRRGTDTSRVSSVSSQFSDGPQHSPSSHSSTPSWSEEPAQSNMDISTGHMILVRSRKLEFRLHFASNMRHVSIESENHTLTGIIALQFLTVQHITVNRLQYLLAQIFACLHLYLNSHKETAANLRKEELLGFCVFLTYISQFWGLSCVLNSTLESCQAVY